MPNLLNGNNGETFLQLTKQLISFITEVYDKQHSTKKNILLHYAYSKIMPNLMNDKNGQTYLQLTKQLLCSKKKKTNYIVS